MVTKSVSTSSVYIKHRMSDDEKKLFRILFEYALPEWQKKEHVISASELLKLYEINLGTAASVRPEFIEGSFWNLGTTITYECTVNPDRPSWGTFALFYGRSIKENGAYCYSYNQEFKKLFSSPIIYQQLLQENLIPQISDCLPQCSSESEQACLISCV